jgi:hypothetical protein
MYVTGQLREALIHHTAALAVATKIEDFYEQARAHNGLANVHHATGHLDLTRHRWQQALTFYTDLNIPDSQAIRAHPAELDSSDHDSNERNRQN